VHGSCWASFDGASKLRCDSIVHLLTRCCSSCYRSRSPRCRTLANAATERRSAIAGRVATTSTEVPPALATSARFHEERRQRRRRMRPTWSEHGWSVISALVAFQCVTGKIRLAPKLTRHRAKSTLWSHYDLYVVEQHGVLFEVKR